MIRGGNGKLKGKRNRREGWPPSKYRTRVWRRSGWRFATRIASIDSIGGTNDPDLYGLLGATFAFRTGENTGP